MKRKLFNVKIFIRSEISCTICYMKPCWSDLYQCKKERSCTLNGVALSDVSPRIGMIKDNFRGSSREGEGHILIPDIMMLMASVSFRLHAVGVCWQGSCSLVKRVRSLQQASMALRSFQDTELWKMYRGTLWLGMLRAIKASTLIVPGSMKTKTEVKLQI
jgi:hypothetical protein